MADLGQILVSDIVFYRRHHTHILYVGCVIVAVRYAELALCGTAYLAQFAIGVLGELLCRGASVLG